MKSLYLYVIPRLPTYNKLKQHYELIQHCLDNEFEYGVHQPYKKDSIFFFLKDTQWYFKEPTGYLSLPYGLRMMQHTRSYAERTGVLNNIVFSGEHVNDFMVMMKTCNLGDIVQCSRELKLFIHNVVNGE